ncbi:hypothetical protein EA187_19625 [Lujinxingia sediminis]|uniref:Lipoprotein n=1 Tax=Lujinxingia sediminis TaxID=2480984 RepID=A0ABY0CMV1_9DELT|nr:hypothetical protein [Lujinxingia sediminis]RVU40991.1 hypothetical protein EA187_19625 [Lujinxingia sediminis]
MSGVRTRAMMMLMAAAVVMTTACDDRARQEGEEGNVQFFYLPADNSTEFNRPLAVGSGMLLYLEGIDDRQVDRVVEMKVEPEGIFEVSVSRDYPHAVVLSGRRAGEARLSVEVEGGGERFSDATTFKVADVARAELAHVCGSTANAAYLVGTPVTLDFRRYSSGGDMVVGSTRSCGLELSPEEVSGRGRCDEAGFHLSPFTQPGPVLVKSTIAPHSGSRRELGVQVITADVLDFDTAEGRLHEGRTDELLLRPITRPPHGDIWPVCNNLWMNVEVLTPETCLGPDGSVNFDVEPSDENTVSLKGMAPGLCEISVILPQLNDYEWIFDAVVEQR